MKDRQLKYNSSFEVKLKQSSSYCRNLVNIQDLGRTWVNLAKGEGGEIIKR